MIEIKITTEYIKLDQFLKLSQAAQTGGHAKLLISEGIVKVNGEVSTQRGKKIRKGDIVDIVDGDKFIVK
ncbi:RNA-binding S4 domain-containing protein [Wansuia hejianensis]|uniref:RNA-binding S4 domain-containing protein n=1 Tax=Wansuia hejianensis TaxID=2763667 RepID=A0A926IM65_9FIRM|nr:RNA-binding S4 domain-containing protein [Wansuia hejianensis]MBC8590879.1 RNA-binding S4 domain-containing protein [Wansuia hejianensis]